jgi:anti-sigma B factor antagonist
MKIDCSKNGGILTVSLDGRLDTTTAPAFEGFLAEQYESSDALVIDCAKLAYISSAGLRVLLSAQKKTKGAMKLTNVCELVMEVFEMTGFADILSIEA